MHRPRFWRAVFTTLVPAALAGLLGCGPDGAACPEADLASDRNNCGGCGHVCSDAQVCSNGWCTVPSETEPNDTLQTADTLPSIERHFQGSIDLLGDVDVVRFTLTTTSDVRLETFDGSGATCVDADTFLELLGPDGTSLAWDDDSGQGLCSAIAPADHEGARRLEPGTYFARIGAAVFSTIDAYTLVLQRESACGDGAVTGSERCDDGNTMDGDGCSHACQREISSAVEREPNDTAGEATALVLPAVASGALSPAGDVDYYRFTLSAPADVTVGTTDTTGDGSCTAMDTVLELRTEGGALVASDDDSGPGLCSALDPAVDSRVRQLSAGTYVVRVTSFGGEAVSGYRLSAR